MPEHENETATTTVEATQRPISGKWVIDTREAGTLHHAISAANPTQGGAWLQSQLDGFTERAELALERGDGEFTMSIHGARLRVTRPAIPVDPETGQVALAPLQVAPLPDLPDAVYEVEGTVTLGDGRRLRFNATAESANRWGADTATCGAAVDVIDGLAQLIWEGQR